MVYENLKWIESSPTAHPTVSVSLDLETSGYKTLGLMPPPPTLQTLPLESVDETDGVLNLLAFTFGTFNGVK